MSGDIYTDQLLEQILSVLNEILAEIRNLSKPKPPDLRTWEDVCDVIDFTAVGKHIQQRVEAIGKQWPK